ncbi:hypothetical protein AB838_05560 [Rhodobacteraceae bacterium (ex Bugula neritina AB1)]|nr:hypothetical protein AB838_05560 [Rhodobacteraceae bacterium (ex Bugula neritina AB1)]
MGDPSDGREVEFLEDGRVNIDVGRQSNGQGHETVHAGFPADQSGLSADRIQMFCSDRGRNAQGDDTSGPGSAAIRANAPRAAVDRMIAAFTSFLAQEMGVAEDVVEFDGETFWAPGSNLTPTMLEAMEMARAQGRTDLQRHAARAGLPDSSLPDGANISEIVIDPEAGQTDQVRYTVVDDFGNLINLMSAEGQVNGGAAQGLEQTMLERVVFDAEGRLLTVSFLGCALPRASRVPMIGITTEPVPLAQNQLGMNGSGEAGAAGAPVAVANAVQDRGIRQVDMPFTPSRIWEVLRDVSEAAEQ